MNRHRELLGLGRQVTHYLDYLQGLGVNNLPLVRPIPPPDSVLESFKETLEDIRNDLGECFRCELSGARKRIVFGEGHPRADLMFVGGAPIEDEDREGDPFTGEVGQVLTDIIVKGIEMRREDCYLTTLVKCRPPEDRDPHQPEIRTCRPFLFRQISSIRPKVICILGQTAAQGLLGRRESLPKLRHRFHDLSGIPVMPTFHPAYLLEYPEKRREVWEDIKMIIRYLGDTHRPEESS